MEDTRQVLPFEDVVKVVEDRSYYTVSSCPCRHRHNLDPGMADCLIRPRCVSTSTSSGATSSRTGWGARSPRKRPRDPPQVGGLGAGARDLELQRESDTICNCCSCCCMWLEAHHKLGHEESLERSNYKVRVEAESCKGCALCVKRCPMDALQLRVSAEAKNKVGKVAVVDLDLCIGCGVCVHKCPATHLRSSGTRRSPSRSRPRGSGARASRPSARRAENAKM